MERTKIANSFEKKCWEIR